MYGHEPLACLGLRSFLQLWQGTLSTRQELARYAVRGKRFIIGLLKQKESAMSIFEKRAGLEPGAALPLEPSDVPLLQKDVEQYESVVEYVLEVCGGWLLPLAMCGALVRASRYQWGEVRERIRASVVAVESDIA
jgi:hypothetical protein